MKYSVIILEFIPSYQEMMEQRNIPSLRYKAYINLGLIWELQEYGSYYMGIYEIGNVTKLYVVCKVRKRPGRRE